MLIVGAIGFVYLAPETATRFFFDLERKRAGLVRKEIDLPDGTHYVYLEGGQGEPLMLLHGFGGNKDNFVRAARFLTPHYRVIMPDNAGFGESSHQPDADYSPATGRASSPPGTGALGIKSLDLGGNSMGGHVPLSMAHCYPAEVKSLWLLDTGGVSSAARKRTAKGHTRNGPKSADDQKRGRFCKAFPVCNEGCAICSGTDPDHAGP